MAKKTVAKPKTYVAIILDKSGSMASTKAAAISGFNEQVQQLKEDSKTQEIYCSLVTFNGEVFEHLWNVPAEKLAEANVEDYVPSGATAMRDAIGYTVQKLLNTTDHADPNTAYLIVTISDGDTNQDKHYNVSALRELSEGCQATKRWTFTYIGCDEQYLREVARQTATPIANMASWSNKTAGGTKRGMSNAAARQKKYFAERGMGQVGTANYACDLNDAVGDYEMESVEAAPAPVLVSQDELVKASENLDLKSVLDRGPKYFAQADVSYNGEGLFANSQQVRWTSEDAGTISNQAVAMAAMPMNAARRGKIK